MSEAKFTLGPWRVLDLRGTIKVIPEGETFPVAKIYAQQIRSLGLKHAHLIASAPELYEALVAVLNAVDGCGTGLEPMMRAAISKARGES